MKVVVELKGIKELHPKTICDIRIAAYEKIGIYTYLRAYYKRELSVDTYEFARNRPNFEKYINNAAAADNEIGKLIRTLKNQKQRFSRR